MDSDDLRDDLYEMGMSMSHREQRLWETIRRAFARDKTLRVGFTGTRNLNGDGEEAVVELIESCTLWGGPVGLANNGLELVHGACVGADAYASWTAHEAQWAVHAVLPEDKSRVDPEWRRWATSWEEGGIYRVRNKKIVQRADVLFVLADYPERHPKSRRSGTWQTCRMAKERDIPVKVMVQHDEDDF